MILNVDAVFIALLALTLIVLVVTGLAATQYAVVPTASDSNALIPRGDDGWLIRYVHSRAVTTLFGLTYLRLALALLALDFGEGRRLAWLCWASWLWAAIFVALSGTMATGLQGDFWFGVVTTGVVTYWFQSLSNWLFLVIWNPRGHQLTLLHGAVAGAVATFSCGVLLAARRRVVARLSTISWPMRVAFCAVILAGSAVTAWLMAWPAPLDNPDNLFVAHLTRTPEHIIPEWYTAPWFQMLRTVPSKGAVSIILWIGLLLPLLVAALPRPRYLPTRIILTLATSLLIIAFVALSTIGRSESFWQLLFPARMLTLFYFAYFVVFVPLLTLVDRACWSNEGKGPSGKHGAFAPNTMTSPE